MRGILTLAIRIKKTDRQGRPLPYLSASFCYCSLSLRIFLSLNIKGPFCWLPAILDRGYTVPDRFMEVFIFFHKWTKFFFRIGQIQE